MGYFSDVSVTLLEKDYESLQEIIGDNNSFIPDTLVKKTANGVTAITMVFNEVKWFPEEQENFAYILMEEFLTDDIPYKICVIGEDLTDNEIFTNLINYQSTGDKNQLPYETVPNLDRSFKWPD